MQRLPLSPDVTVSRLVYGMWRLAEDPDTSVGHIQAKLDACLDQGITSFDQADIYGGYQAEALLGAALTPSLRDRIEIITKCGIVAPVGRHQAAQVKHYDTSRQHIEASVDASLRLLRTDWIDVLLIHRPDPFMDHIETGAALDALVASGKVRAVGVSNFTPADWNLLQSAMTTSLVTNQIEVSLQAHQVFSNGQLAFHQQQARPVMAWSPLAGGALMAGGNEPLTAALRRVAADHGTDEAAVAVAWLLAHPARIIPVLGTNNISRIKSFSDAFKVTMDRQTWFALYSAALGHEVP